MKLNYILTLAAAVSIGFVACEKTPAEKSTDATATRLDDKAKEVKAEGKDKADAIKEEAKSEAKEIKADADADAAAVKKSSEDAAKALEKKADEVKDAPKAP